MWRKARTSLKPGGYGEIGDTGDCEFWEIWGKSLHVAKRKNLVKTPRIWEIGILGNSETSGGLEKLIVSGKTENLLEALEIWKNRENHDMWQK